jgi:hypothetical protein
MTTDILDNLQDYIYGRLTASYYFADITVLNARNGITESEIEQALGTLTAKNNKMGVCVIVLPVIREVIQPNHPGPQYELLASVRILEDPVANNDTTYGTQKSAQKISLEIDKLLHHCRIIDNLVLYASKSEPLQFEDGKNAVDCIYSARGALQPTAKVATPSITINVTATLTCATASASIYYTTDDSYPSAQNPTATLYTAPFNFAGDYITAVAYKTNLQPSDTAKG